MTFDERLNDLQRQVDALWAETHKPPAPTVESVYGKPLSELKPPDGWEFTGEFRTPKRSEVVLTINASRQDKIVTALLDWSECSMNYRLILRKIQPSPTVESVYGKPLDQLSPPNGYRFTGEFRALKSGDWFLSTDCDLPPQRYYGICELGPRLILARAKRLVFDILDEGRSPKTEEWYQLTAESGVGRAVFPSSSYGGCVARYILSQPRVEEEHDA